MSHRQLDHLVPVGTVLPYAGPLANTDGNATDIATIRMRLASDGWLFCDGARLSIAGYSRLYGVIGKAFGGDDTTFYLPDLRGRFIRGVAGNPGPGNTNPGDPDAALRTVSMSGGNDKNRVGSLQQDAFQGHEHDYQGVSATKEKPELGPGDSPTMGVRSQVTSGDVEQSHADGTPRVSSETRPVNLYLNHIIRYR